MFLLLYQVRVLSIHPAGKSWCHAPISVGVLVLNGPRARQHEGLAPRDLAEGVTELGVLRDNIGDNTGGGGAAKGEAERKPVSLTDVAPLGGRLAGGLL
jgi:hypothetical protein